LVKRYGYIKWRCQKIDASHISFSRHKKKREVWNPVSAGALLAPDRRLPSAIETEKRDKI
jgi:hypothetical protein